MGSKDLLIETEDSPVGESAGLDSPGDYASPPRPPKSKSFCSSFPKIQNPIFSFTVVTQRTSLPFNLKLKLFTFHTTFQDSAK